MAAADPVVLIRVDQRSRESIPTVGMTREEAVSSGRLWAGIVRTAPRASSAWHHHAACETAIYVVSGRVRMESGPGGRIVSEARAGDFFHVPSGSIHRETNPGESEAVLVVVRAGSGPAVVNVEGPA